MISRLDSVKRKVFMDNRLSAQLLFLVAFSALVGWNSLGAEAQAGTYSYTVYITGVPSNYGTTVFIDGAPNGTVLGGGSRTFTFAVGTSHAIRVEQYVSGSAGTRYYCSTNTASASKSGSQTFSYSTQFMLTVNSAYGKASGDGWKDANSYAQASLDVTQISSGVGSRQLFVAWGGDASGANPSSNPVLMDGPKTAIANWKTQYLLTVKTDPGGLDSTGSGWYDAGSTAVFNIVSPSSGPPGVRYAFTSWSGNYTGNSPSGSMAMDGPKNIQANFKVQYRLTVQTNPTGLANVTGAGWYNSGESVTINFAPSPISGGAGKRYVFTTWSIDGSNIQGNPIATSMNAPHTVTANYKTQFYLAVKSPYGNAQGEGWYDEGTSATFSVTPSYDSGWIKYVFERWLGDSTASTATATALMDSPRSVAAVYRTDYTMLYALVGVAAAGVAGGGFVLFSFFRKRTGFTFRRHHRPASPSITPAIPAAIASTTISEPSASETIVEPVVVGGEKNCPTCDAPVSESATFCDKCGGRMDGAPLTMGDRVYTYIVSHRGTISLSKAAKDLGITVEELKAAAEDLKKTGRLA